MAVHASLLVSQFKEKALALAMVAAADLEGASPRQLPMVSTDEQHCWSDFSPLPV